MVSKLFITAAVTLTSFTVAASDYWDVCKNENGDVRIEDSRFYFKDQDITNSAKPEVIKKEIVLETLETCLLKNSGQRVVSLDRTISHETIKWIHEGQIESSELRCDRGGSGIPANDECVE